MHVDRIFNFFHACFEKQVSPLAAVFPRLVYFHMASLF